MVNKITSVVLLVIGLILLYMAAQLALVGGVHFISLWQSA